MATTASSSTAIRNPGPYAIDSGLKMLLVGLTAVGIAAFAAGLAMDTKRTWASFVLNHFYFLSLGLGGLFFAAIQWVTGAMWSAPVRRLSEAFTAYLPIALVTFVILYFGIHQIYIWSDMTHVKGDLVLEGKSGYLSTGFFAIRNVIAIGVWIFFARMMIGNSLAQDTSGEYGLTLRNRVLSPIFLVVFGLTFTMVSFDTLMSLDPHWFSTMFGVYCFAGLFYANLAATCLLTLYMRSKGKLDGILNDNHLHDLGKFMFAFTIFWAYIGFSQFMLIWYANLPEETGYFIRRFKDGWYYVSLYLLIVKFMVPFFLLLPRDTKREPGRLAFVAVVMLVSQWVDVLWMVQPEFFPGGPHIGWIEIGVTLGFIGAFGWAVSSFLARHNIVAIKDPRLAESVFHHHQ